MMSYVSAIAFPEASGPIVVSVLAGVALAAAAGLRAFLPLLVVGLASRWGWIHLSPDFAFLSSGVALGALGVATLVELFADKIPLVDHVLDVGSTFVRPAAGFVAAAAVMADLPGPVSIALALFFSMLSLGTHLGRAKARVGSTVTTAGCANPFLSVFEDFVAGALSLLAVLAPIVAVALVILVIVLLARLLRRLGRRTRMAQ